MSDIEQHELYEATIRIRRGEGWSPKPGTEALDGLRMRFRAMWGNDEDEGRYPGEFAMMPDWPDRVPCDDVVWIASGDLEDIRHVPRKERE